MDRYVRNCWYAIGRSEELGAQPIGRALLDQRVVLWRTGHAAFAHNAIVEHLQAEALKHEEPSASGLARTAATGSISS